MKAEYSDAVNVALEDAPAAVRKAFSLPPVTAKFKIFTALRSGRPMGF
jgi:hypothetical protein